MIYCKKCGKDNEDNAWKCVACGTVLHYMPQMPKPMPVKPKTYMWISVLMILSLIPTGIISMLYGFKVTRSFNAGEFEMAKVYSKKAKYWNWISFWIGIVIFIIFLKYVLGLVGQMNSMMEKSMNEMLGQ